MENKLISINRLLEHILTGKVEYLKEAKIAKNLVEELLGEEQWKRVDLEHGIIQVRS